MSPSKLRIALGALFLCASVGLSARGLYLRSQGEHQPTNLPLDFHLQESAEAHGLRFRHEGLELSTLPNVGPWIQSFGASVAVSDINGDGFMDIYAVKNRLFSRNELYMNDGKGHFIEVADQVGLARLNDDNISVRPLIFDCDGDGRKDLFLTSGHCPRVYRQMSSGKFQSVEQPQDGGGCFITEAAAFYDFDHDGALDILVGGINGDGGAGFRTLPTNFVDARNGSELQMLKNDGQCRFHLQPGGFDPKGRFFYHSIGLGDLRGKGTTDVWIATDFNSDKVFLKEDGGYTFHAMEGTNSRFGMNSEFMYLEGSENPYVFVSHSYRLGYIPGGNALWHFANGKFENEGDRRGLRKCGWAWGGRAIDLNNDGELDLAVANGFLRGDEKKDYWYAFTVMAATAEMISSRAGFWPDMTGKNFSGFERDCLFLNRDGHFIDVADQAGFDLDRFEGRAVAVIDAENRGVQDLLVINQNAPARFYRNEIAPRRHWIGFAVEPLGTKITVFAGSKAYRRENFATNSYAAQSDPRLHFGLGEMDHVDRIEVRWPSGKVQTLTALPVDRYHTLKEPQ